MGRLSGENQNQKKMSVPELKKLINELLSSKSNINNLPIILQFVSPSSLPEQALESLLTLQTFFARLLPDITPSKISAHTIKQAADDPDIIYRTWLRSKFDDFIFSLITICTSPKCQDTLRSIALDAVMEFVKQGNDGKFQSAIYHRFLHGIVYSAEGVNILTESFFSEYLKYIDVRYFTYISIEKLSQTLKTKNISGEGKDENDTSASLELGIRNVYYILSHIPPKDEVRLEMWATSGISLADGEFSSSSRFMRRMKLKFSKAWLGFLRLPLPVDVYKEVLVSLDQLVVPHISNPIILSDFLTRSYDIGGVVSVMALSSLYLLMTWHGLEYPNFYVKLYALLVPSIFMAKHRDKFFQLLDSCLKCPLLPAYLAASFAKKLSRLSLSVPPSGSIVIIALIHNLLYRHPSINCLVQYDEDDGTEKDNGVDDATEVGQAIGKLWRDEFKEEELDPLKTNAMRSSLWEVGTLQHHYCPPVSSFVLSLQNDLTVRSKTNEVTVADFSAGSYGTIFREETRRRVKQVPLAFYKETPTALFPELDFPGWSFKWNDEDQGSKEFESSMDRKRSKISSS